MAFHPRKASILNRSISILLASFVLLIILMPFALAFGQHTTFDAWGLYQKNQRRLGDEEYTSNSGLWDGYDYIASVTEGSNFQPLAEDIDNNGIKELVFSSGNYLKIYDLEGTSLTLKEEFNLGSPQLVMGSMIPKGVLDATNNIPIVVVFNHNISIFEYNGTTLYLVQSHALGVNTTLGNATSGLVCEHFNGAGTNSSCYFADDNGKVQGYNIQNNDIVPYTISASNIFNTANSETYSPAMEDIDRDGAEEIVFMCDANVDGYEGICVFDQSLKDLDPAFSGDGVLDNIFDDMAYGYIKGVSTYNMNAVGDTEVIVTGYCRGAVHTSSNEDAWITAYKADGTVYVSKIKVCDESCSSCYCEISTPATDVFNYQTCVVGESIASNQITSISCINGLTGVRDFAWSTTYHQNADYYPKTLVSAQLMGDTRNELVTGNFMYYLNMSSNTTIALNITPNGYGSGNTGFPMFIDMNGDFNLDICSGLSAKTFCVFPQYSNAMPHFVMTLGQDYISPVCVNTSVTFTGRECGVAPCHYTNDFQGDTERLVSDCGDTGNLINGSWTSATQSYSCFFNQTGTYNFNIYLQDLAHADNFTEYQTKSIYVIEGVAGVSCNLPVSEDILTGANETGISADDELTSEADISYAIELVTAQSGYMKALLVMIFTIVFIFGLAKYGGIHNPFIFAISCFMLWILFALLGLLSWIYVLIYAIVAIGLTSVVLVQKKE